MPEYKLEINGEERTFEVIETMPLLWVLRDELGLTGTKFGCGMGLCGACTVLVDGKAQRSCLLTAAAVDGKAITTIEGLSEDATHPVQAAWIEMNVPQCGYCQAGQMIATTALLQEYSNPTEEQINQTMSQIICRCGTYYRISKAIKRAAELKNTAL